MVGIIDVNIYVILVILIDGLGVLVGVYVVYVKFGNSLNMK